MSTSGTDLGFAGRAPRTRGGWTWKAPLALAALACAFTGAAGAQTYNSLDRALGEIVGDVVDGGGLRGKAVLVSPNNFTEAGTGRNLRLSSHLATRSVPELRRHGAEPVSASDDMDRVVTLRGEWNVVRESGQERLYLFMEAKRLAGSNEVGTLASEDGYVPVERIDRVLLEPDIESHGRDLVRKLERNIPGANGRYRLLARPFTFEGMAQPESERLGRYLLSRWRPAFSDSRKLALVRSRSDRFDGELFGEGFAVGGRIHISLHVSDGRRGTEVAAASDEMDGKLLRGFLPGTGGTTGPGPDGGGLPPKTRFRDCTGCPELVVVPPGSFRMGSPGSGGNEGPEHDVTIARPFAVGVYEVTFDEWEACVSDGGCGGYRPDDEGWGRGNRPVVNVSWDDAKGYVEWLSGKTGKGYRLLSESEWEYVARGGTVTRYWWGDDIGSGRANCDGCGSRWDGKRTSPVGAFSGNGYGLYDVHGNVWEWVEDCWNDSYVGAPGDGRAWDSGQCGRRVLRGGSWGDRPRSFRSANRNWNATGDRSFVVGFRVARTLTP